MTTLEQMRDFLGQKRLAIAGVSRRPDDFSRALFREFQNRGYDTVLVNPQARAIEGRPCFARVQEVYPPVDGLVVMTSPALADDVVRDCLEAGVRRVWLFRGAGSGAVSDDAVRTCRSSGISVIPGECPFMFFPGTAWFHRFHGLVKKIAGSYPR